MTGIKTKTLMGLLLLAVLLILLGTSSLAAPAEDEYDLGWFTLGGGGPWMASQDGVYGLGATMGQGEIGEQESSGGEYSLAGGFWSAPDEGQIFLPLVSR